MNDLKKIAEKIKEADALLIGASNGLQRKKNGDFGAG